MSRPACGQVFHGVGVVSARHILFDDRAFVQVCRHIVRCGNNQLHAPVVGLVVGLGTLKFGQETVVDVDGTARQLAAISSDSTVT